jgi:hypothetical protein
MNIRYNSGRPFEMEQPAGCRLEDKWSVKMVKMKVFRMAGQYPMAEAYVFMKIF